MNKEKYNQLEEILNSNIEDLGVVIWYHMFIDEQDIICKALQGASEMQIKAVCNTVSRKMARKILDNIQIYQCASAEEISEARRILLVEIAGIKYGGEVCYCQYI